MTRERNEATAFADRVDFLFWDGLAEGRLRIQRCAACAAWQWPADWRCPQCGSYEFEWPEIEPVGSVYSWIRTHYPFVPGYTELLPYRSVLVELPQAGGARLMGLLESDVAPRVGARVAGRIVAATPETLDLPVLRWRLVDA